MVTTMNFRNIWTIIGNFSFNVFLPVTIAVFLLALLAEILFQGSISQYISSNENQPDQIIEIITETSVLDLFTFIVILGAALAYWRQANAMSIQADIAIDQHKLRKIESARLVVSEASKLMEMDNTPTQWFRGLRLLTDFALTSSSAFHQDIIEVLIQAGKEHSQNLKVYMLLSAGGSENNEREVAKNLEINNFIFFILKRIAEINAKHDKISFPYKNSINIDNFYIPFPRESGNEHFMSGKTFENIRFYKCDFKGVFFSQCNFYDAQFRKCQNIKIYSSIVTATIFLEFFRTEKQPYSLIDCFAWSIDDIRFENFKKLGHDISVKMLDIAERESWLNLPAPRITDFSKYIMNESKLSIIRQIRDSMNNNNL